MEAWNGKNGQVALPVEYKLKNIEVRGPERAQVSSDFKHANPAAS